MTRARMTQVQRVEQLLRRRGEHGVTAADFLLPHVVDGLKPVARLAARIDELRSRGGLTIHTEGTRGGFAVYVLRETQRVTSTTPSASPPADQLALATPPRSAIYGLEDPA